MEDEAAFFKDFESMFGMGGNGDNFFDHFDDFATFLESDTKYMTKMFRDLGKNTRVPGKRRKYGGAGGRGGFDEMDMMLGMGMGMGGGLDDMLNFFMMPGAFMGGKNKNKSKKKSNKNK